MATVKNEKKKRWVATVKTDSTHPPAGLFTERGHDRSQPRVESRFSQGAGIGHAHAHLFHQSGRTRTERNAPRGIAEGQDLALKANQSRKRIRLGKEKGARLNVVLTLPAVRPFSPMISCG